MNTFFWILIAVLLDGAAGLAGGLIPTEFIHRHLSRFLAFAAGTLIAVAFLDLLPEAIEMGLPAEKSLGTALVGFTLFHLLTSQLGSHAVGQSGHKHHNHSSVPLILIGDAIHNVTDGIAIAAAFLTDVKVGIVTTLTVIVHELPQEVGDYSILISNGWSKVRAMAALFAVQLSAMIGALVTYWAAQEIRVAAQYLISLSAGGFVYIAAADLLPELQRHKDASNHWLTIAAFCVGILIIALLSSLHAH